MGTDAEVFVFDHQAYITEVVPAFLELLRDGRTADWLRPFLERDEVQPGLWDRTDLARFCNYLRQDLSWRGSYDLTDTYGLKWDERSCKSEDCPERGHCPFHRNGSETIACEINWLFKIASASNVSARASLLGAR